MTTATDAAVAVAEGMIAFQQDQGDDCSLCTPCWDEKTRRWRHYAECALVPYLKATGRTRLVCRCPEHQESEASA